MIDHERFRRLRMMDFLVPSEITSLRDWEYEEHVWVGEAHGFSEWLRLASTPDDLSSLAIDFASFPDTAAREVLRKLELPVRRGMTIEDIVLILGQPRRTQRFVPDRTTYEFTTTAPDPFRISCTVLIEGGLTYLDVMIPIPRLD